MRWQVLTTFPGPELEAKWFAFLSAAVFPTHYTTPNFFIDPFIRGGQRFAILSFDDAGEITAVLTGIDGGKKIGSGLPTRPQLTFRENTNKREAIASLFGGLREKGAAVEVTQVHAWEEVREFEHLGFRRRSASEQDSVIMLDLSKGADEIFKGFSQTRRSELRKAIKQGLVEIRELETEGELMELYEIHKDWNHRKGNEPDTFEDLKLAAAQTEHRKIFIAKYENRVIAGSFYRYCRGGIVEYAANNSMPEYQRLRPNDLIGWHAIQWACEQGFPLFSMGGAHLFLRRFGGEHWQTYRYSLDNTFLKRHEKREQLSGLAHRVYGALPNTARERIRQIAGKS